MKATLRIEIRAFCGCGFASERRDGMLQWASETDGGVLFVQRGVDSEPLSRYPNPDPAFNEESNLVIKIKYRPFIGINFRTIVTWQTLLRTYQTVRLSREKSKLCRIKGNPHSTIRSMTACALQVI